MLVAIEALIPIDLLMDACILAAVQLALDRPCLKRLFRALILSFCMTAICILLPFVRAGMPAAFLLNAYILIGRRRIKTILEAALAIFCAYAACAGFAVLTDRSTAATLICLCLFSILIFRRRHIRSQWNAEVILEKNGVEISFTALIDTGNRLKEHHSGLPVLIAEESILSAATEHIRPDECVSIPYGVLGSSGELVCFLPDRLSVICSNGKAVPAPECYIGIFPTNIPGKTRALAPPEFAQCEECSPFSFIAQIKFGRRYSHGVFKHKAIHLWPGCTDPQGIGMLHRRQ